MSLPNVGDSAWGVPLNDYITSVVLAQANTAEANIQSHEVAADPHGDRAYALSLVQPLTTGVNGPNGFLQLSNIGKIPTGVLPPGGGRTSAFDVVKDYGAPTNGTAAATDIQNALNDAGTAGGGEVWVGDGNFGIDSTLYVPSNVWLHLSPGAVMTRIVNSGSGQAPVYMAANFNGNVSSSGSGNILIDGGSWVFDGPGAAGIPMAFVGGTGIVVRGASVRTLQGSPAVLFAGCARSSATGLSYATATPVSARTAYASAPPAVRIETAASAVIAGLNSAMYTGAACTAIWVTGSAITGATASDGSGLYTAFGGLAGTTAAVASSFHTDIFVTGNTAIALPYNGVYPANWQTMTVTGNQLNLNDGATSVASWNPSAPGTINQIVANNGPTDSGSGTFAYKTGSTVRSNTTTLTLDPGLQVTVAAGAVYEVRCSVFYQSASTTEGIDYDFQVPSGSFVYAENLPITTGGGAGVYWNDAGNPDDASTGGSFALQFTGLLETGVTGGTFGFKWAQNSSSGTSLTVLASSYVNLTRLA